MRPFRIHAVRRLAAHQPEARVHSRAIIWGAIAPCPTAFSYCRSSSGQGTVNGCFGICPPMEAGSTSSGC
jgi:hypothetical protein